MLKNIFLFLFIAAGITDLLFVILGYPDLRMFSKPALMPLLILLAVFRFRSKDKLFYWLIGALFFSWGGDIFLLFETNEELYFMLGLGSFLVAHILYIVSYYEARYPDTETELLPTQQMRYLFILILAGSGVIYVLYPLLGSLRFPVIIYAGVLVYMVITALYRFGRTSNTSFTLVFLGAIVFMVSDSMLALNKFLFNIDVIGFWVMLTYILAQYMIMEGLAQHKKE